MAKTPTIAAVGGRSAAHDRERGPARARAQHAEPGRLVLAEGEVELAKDAVVVHCTAPGLQYRPLVPIWGSEGDHPAADPGRLSLLRRGAHRLRRRPRSATMTRRMGCALRRRTRTRPADWARMQVLGRRASMAFAADPEPQGLGDHDVAQPGTGPPDLVDSAELGAAVSGSAPTSARAWPGWRSSPACRDGSEQ